MRGFRNRWFAALIVLCLASVSGFGQSGVLTGAGSTFVNPLMSKWSKEYHTLHPSVEINYQSIGFRRRPSAIPGEDGCIRGQRRAAHR